MNEPSAHEIRIFKPFDEGFNLMKRMLFQPFDLSKWLTLGFAAFLAGHFNAGGGLGFSSGNWRSRAQSGAMPDFGFGDHKVLFISILIGLGLFVLIFALVYAWVRARGTFVFTDCIVRSRAAIKEPWREYRREGNSYFLFFLAFFCIVVLVIAIIGGLIFLFATVVTLPRDVRVPAWIAVAVICLVAYVTLIVGTTAISYFMPIVMYRRRCGAWEAFQVVAALMWRDPGSFVLFCLFGILLFIGWAMVAGVVTCATCCMAMLPYVGTVLLLPVFVWFRSFGLFFFRQFGNDYDVWAGVDPLPAPPPIPGAPTPPPLQIPPPPPAV